MEIKEKEENCFVTSSISEFNSGGGGGGVVSYSSF